MINPNVFAIPVSFLNALYQYIILPALSYTEDLLLGKARQAIFDQENLINNELTPAAKRSESGVKVGLMSLKLFISELYLNYDLVAAAGQPEPTVDKTAALVMDIGPGYKVHLHSRNNNCEPSRKIKMQNC